MKYLLITTCTFLFFTVFLQAQETKDGEISVQKKEKLKVKIKDDANPDIYVDGKKFDFPMELIDQDQIASVSVIKGEQAIKDYNAPNGVVVVSTKWKAESDTSPSSLQIKPKEGKKEPVIIIDGEVVTNDMLEVVSPEDIDNIQVVKDQMAIEKYNAPNGVIIVTTKKKAKKDKKAKSKSQK